MKKITTTKTIERDVEGRIIKEIIVIEETDDNETTIVYPNPNYDWDALNPTVTCCNSLTGCVPLNDLLKCYSANNKKEDGNNE